MAEETTATVQGQETTATAGTEKTFTQADVDRIVESRLAADRARQPNDAELKAYRDWKKTQQTESEKRAELEAALTAAQNENAQLKAEKQVSMSQAKPEFTEFVATKVRGMEGDFGANLEKFKKENPQFFGETVVKRTATAPNLSGGGTSAPTTNQIMNDLFRNRG